MYLPDARTDEELLSTKLWLSWPSMVHLRRTQRVHAMSPVYSSASDLSFVKRFSIFCEEKDAEERIIDSEYREKYSSMVFDALQTSNGGMALRLYLEKQNVGEQGEPDRVFNDFCYAIKNSRFEPEGDVCSVLPDRIDAALRIYKSQLGQRSWSSVDFSHLTKVFDKRDEVKRGLLHEPFNAHEAINADRLRESRYARKFLSSWNTSSYYIPVNEWDNAASSNMRWADVVVNASATSFINTNITISRTSDGGYICTTDAVP